MLVESYDFFRFHPFYGFLICVIYFIIVYFLFIVNWFPDIDYWVYDNYVSVYCYRNHKIFPEYPHYYPLPPSFGYYLSLKQRRLLRKEDFLPRSHDRHIFLLGCRKYYQQIKIISLIYFMLTSYFSILFCLWLSHR